MADYSVPKSLPGVSRDVLPFRRGPQIARPSSRLLMPPALRILRSPHQQVARGLSAPHAFARLARQPLERLADGEGLPAGELRPDAIHDFRVAARHLRALLAAFEECLDAEAVAFLRRELAWLQHRLAPARDWDVFIQSLASLASDDPGAVWLLAAAQRRRDLAYDTAQAVLNNRRYARLILRFRFWLDSLEIGDDERRNVEDVMAGYLRKHFRKLLRALRQGGLSDSEMHRLRLRMKKVSDIGRLAKLLYQGDRRDRFIDRLGKLQETLGKRQDAVVGRQLAAELGKLAPEATQKAIAAIVARETARIAKQTDRFKAKSSRLFRLKTFWRKAV